MPRGRNLYNSLYQHLVSMPDSQDTPPKFMMTCSALRIQRDAGEARIDMLPRDTRQLCLLEDMRNCAGCDVLMTRPAALRCAVCRVEYYCSLRCQKAHWPEHKQMCGPASKRDRRANEAMQTASRIVWVLYTQRIADATSHTVALDTQDCLLARFKPDAHDKLLTIFLLTKKQVEADAPNTPEANTQQALSATFLDPQKLMVALKAMLRNSMNFDLSNFAQLSGDEYLSETIQDFRNSVIKLHTVVKKATSLNSMLERTRNRTHLFVLITPMQSDWCNLLWFRCLELQANFYNERTLCAELLSEFGHKDRVEYKKELQAKQEELQRLVEHQKAKKRADKQGKKLSREAEARIFWSEAGLAGQD